MSETGRAAAQEKMRAGGVHDSAIEVFSHYYRELESGATGIVAEADIDPLGDPTRLVDLANDRKAGHDALDVTVIIKLNGGLGTSMGMDKAKSLLPVRDGLTFLDIIAKQVLRAREEFGARLPLVFMNSFRTRDDTLEALSAYPDLATPGVPLDFLQNREPKIRVDDLMPVEWPKDPSLEWCPPGHGDIYTALTASGLLSRLLEEGYQFAFVSNSDNLCATADPRAASWFAASGAPFASEVCRRTSADRKGGHLAIRKRDRQLILRESAQTAPEDLAALQDVARHRYVTTNNLWMDLHALEAKLKERHGVLGLPLIRNEKTVDPADKTSPAVVQIETAMGAAVEVFEGAQALEVERARFLPVKSTNDLLALRSDVYHLADDYDVTLVEERDDAPHIELDPNFYQLVADFDARFPDGPPSLIQASSLEVHGDWTFDADVVIRGDVIIGADGSPGRISDDPVPPDR